MNPVYDLGDLEKYALNRIASHRYPGDIHTFKLLVCPVCGVVPLSLTIEHHSGSKKGNFRGVIYGKCSSCGESTRIFSFTGSQREKRREEKPVCKCGHTYFLVGECERIERENGLVGFFDEGVVVGKCSDCNRNRSFVFTD